MPSSHLKDYKCAGCGLRGASTPLKEHTTACAILVMATRKEVTASGSQHIIGIPATLALYPSGWSPMTDEQAPLTASCIQDLPHCFVSAHTPTCHTRERACWPLNQPEACGSHSLERMRLTDGCLSDAFCCSEQAQRRSG